MCVCVCVSVRVCGCVRAACVCVCVPMYRMACVHLEFYLLYDGFLLPVICIHSI